MLVYIADHTSRHRSRGTLNEQVALETRTRLLNPKWYESMLDHGYEGVRQIEAHHQHHGLVGYDGRWSGLPTAFETFVLDEDMRVVWRSSTGVSREAG